MISETALEHIYNLCSIIEERKKFLFVIINKNDLIGIDVLDYETEDALDGGWYNIQEAEEFLTQYLEDI